MPRYTEQPWDFILSGDSVVTTKEVTVKTNDTDVGILENGDIADVIKVSASATATGVLIGEPARFRGRVIEVENVSSTAVSITVEGIINAQNARTFYVSDEFRWCSIGLVS